MHYFEDDEAKKLGVEMAGPYFKAKPLIEQFGIETFSSNYNLYGDMSWRVMETLRQLVGGENVEVYSVDEAFLDLNEAPESNLRNIAMNIRKTVEQWTGVAVSVGVPLPKFWRRLPIMKQKKTRIYKLCNSP